MSSRRFISVLIVGIFLVVSPSCKKAIEQKYQDIVTQMMVDGTWTVTKFTEGSADVTSSFNGWVFKFNDNNTVNCTLGTTVQTGNWSSSVSTQTISAQFPSSVGDPLQKLNGTWAIANSTTTVGRFTQTKNGIYYTMELTKN